MFGSETETQNNLIETYSDSDWSNRSTSAAVHVWNGIVIWSTSRTQKCISLSSTEAEWYAATSAVCDSLFLHHILSFLTDDEVGTVVFTYRQLSSEDVVQQVGSRQTQTHQRKTSLASSESS